jgi:hypothetical protein
MSSLGDSRPAWSRPVVFTHRASWVLALLLVLGSVSCSAENVIRVAPAAQTGLFVDVGPLSPHGYRPNEFFSNDWVYEGLVKYSEGGEVGATRLFRNTASAACCLHRHRAITRR